MTIGYNELPNSLSERQRSLRAKLEAEKNPSRIGRPQSRDWSQAPLPELSRHIAILRNRKLKAKNVATIQDYEKEIRALTKVRTRRVKQARVNKQKRRREQTRRARERRQEQRKEESQQRSKDRIVQDFQNRDFYKYKSWHATEASEMEPLVTYRKTDENFWVRLDPKFLAVTGRQE